MGRKANNSSATDAGAAVDNDRMINLALHSMNDVDDGRRILWERLNENQSVSKRHCGMLQESSAACN
jgi:hypothetical protein